MTFKADGTAECDAPRLTDAVRLAGSDPSLPAPGRPGPTRTAASPPIRSVVLPCPPGPTGLPARLESHVALDLPRSYSLPGSATKFRSADHTTNQDTNQMDIQTERKDGTLIAKAEGRIDGVNARDFEEALKAAISDEDSTVVMDLEGLSYISSAGLRVILLIAKTLRKRNAELMLCSLSDPIREVFEISGFDKIIPVHASREQALAAAGN